jgi:ELWxxDGT repeat protein
VVDVTVTIPGAVSALGSSDRFTYTLAAAPAVSGLSTTSGTTAGGISITITGTGFTGASAVNFGSVAANFIVNSDTSISATVPPQSITGSEHVQVITPSGGSVLSGADLFMYSAAAQPTLTSLSPTSGSSLGGDLINLIGTGFSGATAVSFGGVNATFEIQSDTWITATVPAQGAGSQGVTVTSTGGTSNSISFTYVGVPTPAITGLTATSGSTVGGDTVIILGSGFSSTTGVTFGSEAADFAVLSDNAIQTTTPESAAGSVTLTVTTLSGTATSSFTFNTPPTPTVTGRSPTSGGSGGGTGVIVTGTGFTTTAGVSFGGVAATAFVVNSDTQLTVLSPPANAVATVDITVTTAGGTSSTSAADQFTYVAAATPAVSGINPTSGPTAGGNTVIIQGTALLGATGVTFDTLPATSFTVLSDSYILAVAPTHTSGSGHVQVTTIINTSTATSADLYTWNGGGNGPMMLAANPGPATNVNGTLFFVASPTGSGDALWKSDGTVAGTTVVKNIFPTGRANPTELTNLDGTLFFAADDGVHGRELWKSDGTSQGTVLVEDINPGSGGSSPHNLTVVRDTLFFVADDGTHGPELWKSNGTAAGTVLVKDINPGSSGSSPGSLTSVNGTLFFVANDGTHGPQLWKSDGTSAGTVLVKSIDPGATGSSPSDLTNVNGTLYFRARGTTTSWELWKSDGTSTGTVLVQAFSSASGASSPVSLTNVNGTLFFAANDGTHGATLWKSNGTAAGTVLVKDIDSVNHTANPVSLTNVNGTLFFQASDSTHGAELWKSDGTAAGTVLVKDINPGSAGSTPTFLTNVHGVVYFQANSTELWGSVGTANSTVRIRSFNTPSGGVAPQLLTSVQDKLFFEVDDGIHGLQLWVQPS